MKQCSEQTQVLALVIGEIRQPLSDYLGSENDGDMAVRQAAHLAYALHNQAEAILVGKSFDVADSVAGLQFLDRMLEADFAERFKRALEQDA